MTVDRKATQQAYRLRKQQHPDNRQTSGGLSVGDQPEDWDEVWCWDSRRQQSIQLSEDQLAGDDQADEGRQERLNWKTGMKSGEVTSDDSSLWI